MERGEGETGRGFGPADEGTWLTYWRPLVSLRAALKRWENRLRSHDEVFDASYFQMVDETTGRSSDIMAESIVDHLAPASVIDLGCGTGNLIESLMARGVQAIGVECAAAALQTCRRKNLPVQKADFRDPATIASPFGTFDLAVNMEVAHQLAEVEAKRFIGYTCAHAETVLFSVPICARDRLPKTARPPVYWSSLFEANHYRLDHRLAEIFRLEWKQKGTAPWFYRNPMVFRRAH